jgi:hypothetical protein
MRLIYSAVSMVLCNEVETNQLCSLFIFFKKLGLILFEKCFICSKYVAMFQIMLLPKHTSLNTFLCTFFLEGAGFVSFSPA